MRQFPGLKVVTFETDSRKNEVWDQILDQSGVERTGRLTTIEAFGAEAEAAREPGAGLLWAANLIIVGDITKFGEGPVSATHIGNGALVRMRELGVAYPLRYVSESFGTADNPYPVPVPAVAVGYGEISTNAAYERATAGFGVHPYGGDVAIRRVETAFTEAARVLQLEPVGA